MIFSEGKISEGSDKRDLFTEGGSVKFYSDPIESPKGQELMSRFAYLRFPSGSSSPLSKIAL